MKQSITIDQWREICKEGDKLYIGNVNRPELAPLEISYNDMTIGGMIEFLGDDLGGIDHIINTTPENYYIVFACNECFSTKELKDLKGPLWQAVKYKVKK